MDPFITPDQTWWLWAVLLACAAFGLRTERTRRGARFSGAVLTLLAAFLLSNLKVIPSAAPTYDAVWSHLVPLAIPLLLFQANLARILRESGPTLLAFGIGTAGTAAGTWIAFHALSLGADGWRLAAVFCATYIGGSMNYMSTAKAVGLQSGDLLTAGIAADNLMMTLYFLVLFALPSIRPLARRFRSSAARNGDGSVSGAAPCPAEKRPDLSLLSSASALALSAAICALAFSLEERLKLPGSGVLILTAVSVLLASVFSRHLERLDGARDIGMLLMQVFFATIGASANVGEVMKVGPGLFFFAALILAVHLMSILIGGRLLRLSLPEILIASNANVGGPSTAAAMAAAKDWQPLVVPAVLCGTLGYVIATFIGVALGHALR